MGATGREAMRAVCVAYRRILDAVIDSPFVEMSKSAALIAELNRP